ncbi:MAG: 50S ribosomal protein L25/general stress protein Ctc [Pseudomonadota bacterium]|nr:50S ribosomal protein L25/general stress protein Ctc [Pseudomonadales bacterium]MEC7390389.1 50S ribosomal protein L25/general stress protein Ctc [Pseudomonadota bacterium]MEC8499172.1 50S ribosomal protein L25/general stress protein Ctc [Pseudomonadota bacterium]|tara:strand:- start:207 stop:881 length:675 start_codon:yes stop_codon:yes gene_type:complete
MSTNFTINAKSREDTGKGASRRLRRLTGEVPAIIYGGKKDAEKISILHKDITKALENDAVYSSIISLSIDGKAEDTIIKDIQRHPAKQIILHMDFLRVSKTTKLQTRVPLNFINEDICVGVKLGGGLIAHTMTDIEVSCLPKDLPESIDVDMAEVDVGQIVHLSDLTLPDGVESVSLSQGADYDLTVATVNKQKAVEIDEPSESESTEDTSAESSENEETTGED